MVCAGACHLHAPTASTSGRQLHAQFVLPRGVRVGGAWPTRTVQAAVSGHRSTSAALETSNSTAIDASWEQAAFVEAYSAQARANSLMASMERKLAYMTSRFSRLVLKTLFTAFRRLISSLRTGRVVLFLLALGNRAKQADAASSTGLGASAQPRMFSFFTKRNVAAGALERKLNDTSLPLETKLEAIKDCQNELNHSLSRLYNTSARAEQAALEFAATGQKVLSFERSPPQQAVVAAEEELKQIVFMQVLRELEIQDESRQRK